MPIAIEEKPAEAAVELGGDRPLFLRQSTCSTSLRSLTPVGRGELEITDVNRAYLERGELQVIALGRGYAWLDTGTPESLHDAAAFVRTIEKRQGLKIMCLEEIGLELGYLTPEQVQARADALGDNDYALYLKRRAAEFAEQWHRVAISAGSAVSPRILVTGGAGFIGSAVVRHAGRQGRARHQRRQADLFGQSAILLRDVAGAPNYRFHQADICDARSDRSDIRIRAARGGDAPRRRKPRRPLDRRPGGIRRDQRRRDVHAC